MNGLPEFLPDEIAARCGGVWTLPPQTPPRGVFTDTRKPVAGALFVALRGENSDGHKHLPQAFAAGACAAIADETGLRNCAESERRFPLLIVRNTETALRNLAAGHRAKVNPLVVGVTGSAGKTTVKEWVAALLSSAFKTHKTPGNFNNHLGLPLSILAMPDDTEVAVFEAGTNHPGEIAPLAALMRPDCAIITNVGPVHIENFGSVEAIAAEKAELLRAAASAAILDSDSPHFEYLKSQTARRVISCGRGDYEISGIDTAAGAFTVFEKSSGETHRIKTGQSGSHNITNALLAIAAARHMGVPWQNVNPVFANPPALDGRWQRIEKNGVVFINDAYNANPLSMVKALERFALELHTGRKIAVLGDMFELGDYAPEAHRIAGETAAKIGLDLLVAVGKNSSRHLAPAAAAAGMPRAKIIACEDTETARKELAGILKPGDSVLLKASRGMALEKTTVL